MSFCCCCFFNVHIYIAQISTSHKDQESKTCKADLWWAMKGVGVKDGLHHDERLCQVLPDKVVPVIRRLIWTVVEHLQEGRPPQVEHKLQVRNKTSLKRVSNSWT